jgi:hypothetical protein
LEESTSNNLREAAGVQARIVYRKGLRRWTREVRPSDAIAIALKLKGQIVASSALVGKSEELCDFGRWPSTEPHCYYLEARDAGLASRRSVH